MIPIGNETPTRNTPYVTWGLIALNTVVFALVMSGGREGLDAAIRGWGFVPGRFSVSTLFTSMFMHGGIFHLVGNMLYLWVFGDNIEDELGHLGFSCFYIVTGLAAGLCHYMFNVSSMMPVVGASGAISGVLGAYIILFPHGKVRVLWWFYWYVRIFRMTAGWLLGFYFAMQFALVALTGGEGGVAYWAHIGGFVAGLVIIVVLLARKVIKRPAAALPKRGPSERGPASTRRLADGTRVATYGDDPMPVGGRADSKKISADAGRRVNDILAAISGGRSNEAVELAKMELKLPRRDSADPWALARVADAFYQDKLHQMAFHVYQEVIRRAPADHARLPEIQYRAGIIASRHTRNFSTACALLLDASRRHKDPKRREAAAAELERVEANLARTGVAPDGGLVTGPCAVIRQTGTRINIAKAGRVVAKISGKPMIDVTRLLRGSVGFMVTGLDPIKARQVAIALQEIDIPVLVVPEGKLVALPEAQRIERAGVAAEGMTLQPLHAHEFVKPWAQVHYASAGMVRFTRRQRSVDPLSGMGPRHYMGGGGLGGVGIVIDSGPNYQYKDVTNELLVFDVFTLEPFSCYRLIDGKVDLSGTPHAQTQSARLNFRHLVSDFLSYGRNVPVNDAVRLVAADAPHRDWRQLTFNTIRDFERYNYWRLQLEQYG